MLDGEGTSEAEIPDRWRKRRDITYTPAIEAFDETGIQLLDAAGRRVPAIRRQAIVIYHPSRGPAYRKVGRVEYVLEDGRQLTLAKDRRSFRIKGTQHSLVPLRSERQMPSTDATTRALTPAGAEGA